MALVCALVSVGCMFIVTTGDMPSWVDWLSLAFALGGVLALEHEAYVRGRADGVEWCHQRGRQVFNRMVRLSMSEES